PVHPVRNCDFLRPRGTSANSSHFRGATIRGKLVIVVESPSHGHNRSPLETRIKSIHTWEAQARRFIENQFKGFCKAARSRQHSLSRLNTTSLSYWRHLSDRYARISCAHAVDGVHH